MNNAIIKDEAGDLTTPFFTTTANLSSLTIIKKHK